MESSVALRSEIQRGGFDTNAIDNPRQIGLIVMEFGNDVGKHVQIYSTSFAAESMGMQQVRQVILRGFPDCRPID
jgi:hypothetical protein